GAEDRRGGDHPARLRRGARVELVVPASALGGGENLVDRILGRGRPRQRGCGESACPGEEDAARCLHGSSRLFRCRGRGRNPFPCVMTGLTLTFAERTSARSRRGSIRAVTWLYGRIVTDARHNAVSGNAGRPREAGSL